MRKDYLARKMVTKVPGKYYCIYELMRVIDYYMSDHNTREPIR